MSGGGNFIDTADAYSVWVDGNCGGESETIIGNWLARRQDRDRLVIATKVGQEGGLGARHIRAAAEASLRRLKTDYIDLYYAHYDDPGTALGETLRAFDELIREGKVRYVAVSNYGAERLTEALAISTRDGLASYVAVQAHYNLVERAGYERELAPICIREGIPCLPYYSLAQGFLTGKYRKASGPHSPRAAAARVYLNDHGGSVLAVVEEIAESRRTTMAAVAIAWLLAQSTVVAPIASARSPEQLAELLPGAHLELSEHERSRLDTASA